MLNLRPNYPDDFLLDGWLASDHGIHFQKEIAFSEPTPNVENIHVHGRNGDIPIYDGSFQNVTGTARCYCLDEDVSFVVNAINQLLFTDFGYRRLETFMEPDHYRMAKLKHGVNLEPRLNHMNPFTLEFDCKPQKYLKDGEWEKVFTSSGKLFNPTPFAALPLITLHGSGSGSLTVGEYTISTTNCNELVMDCEEQEAYIGTSNANGIITGTFPKLEGESSISFRGGVTSVTIIPRWWSL